MKEFNYTITDEQGVHARPAGALCKQCMGYKSAITIKSADKSADAKRLLAVMGMGIKCGQEVVFTVDGEDEDTAATEIAAFLKENL